MQQFMALGIKQALSVIGVNQLALIAVLVLETSMRHATVYNQSANEFMLILLQLLVESSPLLVCHYLTYQAQTVRPVVVWCSGFVLYPILSFSLSEHYLFYANWTIFSVQIWLMLVGASLGFGVSRLLAKRHHTKSMRFMSRLFSLNSVLLMLLVGWAILWAGIFASTDDPVSNQPIKAVINSDTVIVNFSFFINYLWQFLLMGTLVLVVYWLNRYVLIRLILARNGVFAYVAGCLITIIVMTPLLASVVLWLPMNIPDWTFLPSEDHNVFAPINFRFSFFVMAVSTPIILAFERQQQDKALAEIAQQQSQTELQLLQQQVNPHFLFNTLNNLYALTLTSSDKAPTLVMQLANLLRYTVYEGQQPWVTLAQEITYLQDFLALQAIRSGDRCELTVGFPQQSANWQLAPLLLIILVENAFKHGAERTESTSTIELDIQVQGGRLLLHCVNSLPEHPTEHKPGIGLQNLKRRLELLYKGKYQLLTEVRDLRWHAELSLEMRPC
jgi:hypothetical protein